MSAIKGHIAAKVNHRAVNMLDKVLEQVPEAEAALFGDLGYTARTCPEWIPWDEWVLIIERLSEQFPDEDKFRETSLQIFKAPSAIFLLRLVGLFSDLGSMLVRMNELIMRSFFKGLVFETTIDKRKKTCVAKIIIPESMTGSRAFLFMSTSAYESIFRQLKVPYHNFTFECTDRVGIYSFTYETKPGLFERLRRMYRVAVGADFAVKQIAENEEELRRRLEIAEKALAEAKELREKEHIAREIAEEALQVRQRFLAVMSHELRTPLNHIIGCASILKSEFQVKDQEDYVDIIMQSSNNLLEMIELVLDFSSAGMLATEEPQQVSLTDLLDPIIDKVRLLCDRKNLIFEYPSLGKDGPSFVLYLGHVNRILLLLLENAVKFTNEGGISLEFDQPDEERINLRVKDTGIGIPDVWQEKIFEPFHAVDSSETRSFGGVGLGLTIARKLAREIGGDLELLYSTDEGSGFQLGIPISGDNRAMSIPESVA